MRSALTTILPIERIKLIAATTCGIQISILLVGRIAGSDHARRHHDRAGNESSSARPPDPGRKMSCEWGISDSMFATFVQEEDQIFLSARISAAPWLSEDHGAQIDTI